MDSLVESMHKVMQQSDPLLYSLVSSTTRSSGNEALSLHVSVDSVLHLTVEKTRLDRHSMSTAGEMAASSSGHGAVVSVSQPRFSASDKEKPVACSNSNYTKARKGWSLSSPSILSYSLSANTDPSTNKEKAMSCQSGLPTTAKDWLLWMISQHATSLQPAPGLMLLDPTRYQPLQHHHRRQGVQGASIDSTAHDPIQSMAGTRYFKQGTEATATAPSGANNNTSTPSSGAASSAASGSIGHTSGNTAGGAHQLFLNSSTSSPETNSRLQRAAAAGGGSSAKENHSSGPSSSAGATSATSAATPTPTASATTIASPSSATVTTNSSSSQPTTSSSNPVQQPSPPPTRPDAGYVRRMMVTTVTSSFERASDRIASITPVTIQQELVRAKDKTLAFLYRTFSPTYRVSLMYIQSWSDGSQRRGFERIKNNLLRGDAWTLTMNTTAHLKNVWQQVMAARRVSSSGGGTGSAGSGDASSGARGGGGGSAGIQRLARRDKDIKEKEKESRNTANNTKTSSASPDASPSSTSNSNSNDDKNNNNNNNNDNNNSQQ